MSSGLPEIKQDTSYEFKPFRVPKYRIEFQNASRLEDVPGYVWCTPAAIYLWGRYSETNLSDTVQRHDIKIFWYRFDRPIFKGFALGEDQGWNHILWAIAEDKWDKFVDSVLETVQIDMVTKKIYQYALQTLPIYDPLHMDTKILITQEAPKVTIRPFAVLSNERQFAFDVRDGQVAALPQIMTFKPSKLHVLAADRLFGSGQLTQDRAIEKYKRILLEQHRARFEEQATNQVKR